MLKRVFIVILIIGLLFMSISGFAEDEGILKNHWAEKLVDEEFMNDYFYYLFCDDNYNFQPDKEITKEQFFTSLYTLAIKYDSTIEKDMGDNDWLLYFKAKGILTEDVNKEEALLRKEAVKYIINILELYKKIEYFPELSNPFNDLTELSNQEISYIIKGTTLGIIKGYTDGTFKPNEFVTQVQAILLLQRLKGELDMRTSIIPFKVIDSLSSSNLTKECFSVEETENKVTITITKKFPTPGYTMTIDKITKSSDGNYDIYLRIIKPKPGSIVLQVITYKTITIEIDKEDLGEEPYTFSLLSDTAIPIKQR